MNVKKLLMGCIVFCLIASAVVYATETRVTSMGGIGYYIRDNSNIFYFPGTIMQYSNQAVAELRSKGNDQMYTVGLHLSNNSDHVMGVYLNRPLSLPTDIIEDVAPALTLDRCITLFYGGKTSSHDYGILVSVAMDSYKDEGFGDEEKQSARYIAIGGGISNDDYDLGLNVELPSASWTEGDEEDKWGGTGIGLNGRYFSQKSKELECVLLGTLYFGFGGREYGDLEIDYNRLNIGLGAAANYQLDENNMAVLAVEAFGMNQDKMAVKDGDEDTYKKTTLPGIYLGVESQVKSWLIARLGARQVYQTITNSTKPNEGDKTEESYYMSSFSVSFGLGLVLGNLELDALFNEGILFDGPNFISGQNNTLANRISITYHFNKPDKK